MLTFEELSEGRSGRDVVTSLVPDDSGVQAPLSKEDASLEVEGGRVQRREVARIVNALKWDKTGG